MALQAYAEGRYEEAMQRFSDLLYEDPRNPRLHIWLGASFRKAGKLEYAKVQYQQVLTLTTDADLVSLARSSLAQIQQQSILATPLRDSGDGDPMATTLQVNDTGYKLRRSPPEAYGLVTDEQNGNKPAVLGGTHGQGKTNGVIPPPALNGRGRGQRDNGKRDGKSNLSNLSNLSKSSPAEQEYDHQEHDRDAAGKIPPPLGLAPIPPLPPLAVRVKPSSNGHGAHGGDEAHTPSAVDVVGGDGTSLKSSMATSSITTSITAVDAKLGGRVDGRLDDQGNEVLGNQQHPETSVVEQKHDHSLISSVAKGWEKLGRSRSQKKPEGKKPIVTAPHSTESHSIEVTESQPKETVAKSHAKSATGVSLAELISRIQLSESNHKQNGAASKQRMALEDVINFASLKCRATLWAVALATLPVVGVGVMTYQMGDRLIKQQVRQTYLQNSQNISNQVQQFWQEQIAQAKITAQLLTGESANNTNKSTLAKRNLSAAVVTSRLRLYHQANPRFDDLLVVQSDGEVLGRSDTKPSPVIKGTVLMLEPGVLEQVNQSRRPTMVMIPKMPMAAVVVPVGINVTPANTDNKPGEKGAEKGALVVATIPLDAMQERLGNPHPMGVYIADSQGRTLVSQPIKGYAPLVFGSAVSNSFPVAGVLQTSGQGPEIKFQDDVVLGDKNQGLIAYAPLFLQTGNGADLNWGVFLVGEKDVRSSGVLVLAILVAIGATPILVGAIAFLLTHQVTSRINHIKYRVMSVARTGLEDLMRKQTLLIDEAELMTRDSSSARDELGALSKSINDIVEQFQTMLRKQHRQKQHLQNQVVKLVQELSELAEVNPRDALPQDSDIEGLMQSLKTKLNSQKEKEEKYLEERQILQQQLANLAQELSDIQPDSQKTALVISDTSWHELPEFMNGALLQLKTVVNQVKQGAAQMNHSLGHNELTLTQLIALVAQQAELTQHTVNSANTLRQGDLNIIRNGQLAMNMSHQIHAETLQNDQTITELITTLQNMHQSMVQTANVVQGLGDSSQKVNRVLALLNELAVQINFIAINASLEGAKSGNHNSSLITVAEEIGQMANRSVAIAKEVEAIMEYLQMETTEVMQAVESSRDQVATGNNLLQNTQASLQELSGLSQNIHELVTAITETTQFQSKTSESVANLLNNMNQIAHNSLKASEEVQNSLQSTVQINERVQNIFLPDTVD
jgi:methyl-accepting chemotaxis protein PixJ